jgi:hypothetical protein
MIALALPCLGSIAFDPGAQPMVWHVLGASTLLTVLNWRRVAAFVGEHSGLRSVRSSGVAFATAYAVFTVPFTLSFFDGQPMPRFNDVFVVGIALTVYFFSWEPAVYLFVISLLVSAWILPPYGTLGVEGFAEWYRLISFSAVSLFIMVLLTRMKAKQVSPMQSATSGD